MKVNSHQLVCLLHSRADKLRLFWRLSGETLYRYFRDANFLRDYREARRQTLDNAISKLRSATAGAVETLKRNLHCEKAAVK